MDKTPTLGGINPLDQVDISQRQAQLNRVKTLENQSVKSEKELEKAAGGFEALLLHHMLKSMWATVETSGMFGEDSNQAQIYRDMLNQAIADSVAEGRGIGVKEFLKKELLKQTNEAS